MSNDFFPGWYKWIEAWWREPEAKPSAAVNLWSAFPMVDSKFTQTKTTEFD